MNVGLDTSSDIIEEESFGASLTDIVFELGAVGVSFLEIFIFDTLVVFESISTVAGHTSVRLLVESLTERVDKFTSACS